MPTDAYQAREARRKLHRLVSPERFIDFGVRCYVVRQDLANGVEVIPGMAPVSALRHFDLGGVWDTVERRYIGKSREPIVWYCAEAAEEIIQHPDTLPPKILVEAGFGAGKTKGWLSRYMVARALECAPMAGRNGIELLCTSPTDTRLEEFVEAVAECLRPSWYTYRIKSHRFHLHNGVRLRMLGTAKRSNAQGSRVQGFNAAAAGCDELQDNHEELPNIYARGRRAPRGIYKMCATSTPKISSEWREARRKMLATGEWHHVRVDSRTNPMVWPQFWEDQKQLLSPRQYAMGVEGRDVGPERQVYFTFDREQNVRPVPRIGAEDVTRHVLAQYGPNLTVLVGYDPGSRYDVAVMLKAYLLPNEALHRWWVVDELTLERVTTEQFSVALLERLRNRWGCNRLDARGKQRADGNQAHVRIDPFGNTNNKTPITVKQMLVSHGLDARSAAFSHGKGQGIVHREAGIEMVCRLLRNAAGQSRLFIDCDEHSKPCAPRLVDALEMSERDIAERPEHEQKGSDSDRSHWPAALRYALHPLERTPEPAETQQEMARWH